MTLMGTDTPASPYLGTIDAEQAAAAMQAARFNSIDLLESAEILFNLKRFAHSIALSILAIEESGKLPLLQAILLDGSRDVARLWRSYRQHRAKTATLNHGIYSRIRVEFPSTSPEEAQEIAALGPTPDELEAQKQRAIYSDCLLRDNEFVCHLPRNVDWRKVAWERLCEARSIVLAPRDKTPDELEVWIRHAAEARANGKSLADALPDLYRELFKGFVKEGWWDALLADIKDDQGDA